MTEIEKEKDVWTDTAFYSGTVLVAFGLGMRWHQYLEQNLPALLFYSILLLIVYLYWVLRPHR